jgi:hypothetical protein
VLSSFVETQRFRDFPQRQKSASLNIGQILEKMQKVGKD